MSTGLWHFGLLGHFSFERSAKSFAPVQLHLSTYLLILCSQSNINSLINYFVFLEIEIALLRVTCEITEDATVTYGAIQLCQHRFTNSKATVEMYLCFDGAYIQ